MPAITALAISGAGASAGSSRNGAPAWRMATCDAGGSAFWRFGSAWTQRFRPPEFPVALPENPRFRDGFCNRALPVSPRLCGFWQRAAVADPRAVKRVPWLSSAFPDGEGGTGVAFA